MGQKKYPDLSRAEFTEIVECFLGKPDHTKGDHSYYKGFVKGKFSAVQIDHGRDPVFGWVIPETIKALGVSREEFYCCCKSAARKIGKPYKAWNR